MRKRERAWDGSSACVETLETRTLMAADTVLQWNALAVDATRVYWIDRTDGRIQSAPKAGGSVVTLAPTLLPANQIGLSHDSTHVYWAESTKIYRTAK